MTSTALIPGSYQQSPQPTSSIVNQVGGSLLDVEKVLSVSPTNIDALAFGLACARKLGVIDWPEKWLTYALGADSKLDMIREERARAREDSGNFEGAIDDYQTLLSNAPTNYITRLFLSGLIYDCGDHERAAKEAHTAIHHARRAGRWFDSKSTEPALIHRVKKAVELVRSSREILITRVLAPFVSEFGNDELSRLNGAVRSWFSGASQPKNTAQRPKQLYFAGLSDSPFLDKKKFPWFASLEAQTPIIRDEAAAVFQNRRFCKYLFLSDKSDVNDFLANSNGAPTWDAYFFFRHGKVIDEASLECPATSAILADLPLARIPNFGPEVCFSALTPGTHILPHYGDSNIRTVVHLPLIVSGDCQLTVGNESHAWRQGDAVAFDDTFLHEAWNRGKENRLILLMDVWHPDLSLVERLALAKLLPELGIFHTTNDAVC